MANFINRHSKKIWKEIPPTSPVTVLEAAEQFLRSQGNEAAAFVLKAIKNDLNLAKDTKRFLIDKEKPKSGPVKASPIEALSLIMDRDLSVHDYKVNPIKTVTSTMH